jgi:release factor glutamine methyltransferase
VTQTDPWTTRRLLAWIGEAFTKASLDSPRLSAELLVAHVLYPSAAAIQNDDARPAQKPSRTLASTSARTPTRVRTTDSRLRLYTDADRPASADELATLRGLVARALKHEPIQYLVGEGWFFAMPFVVDRRVLIPRPCTEGIVEHLVQAFRPRRDASDAATTTDQPETSDAAAPTGAQTPADAPDAPPRVLIADVCTGSGCIGVALARNIPGAELLATDLSPDALELARINAERLGVSERITFAQGHLLEPARAHRERVGRAFDAIVANPPYIPDHEWADVAPNVRLHEPELALRAGADPLSLVGPIVDGAWELLTPGGTLMVELAACSARDALQRANATGRYAACRIVKDLEGLERFVLCTARG